LIIRISNSHFEPEESSPEISDFNAALTHLADAVCLRIETIRHHTAATSLIAIRHGTKNASFAKKATEEEEELDLSGPRLRKRAKPLHSEYICKYFHLLLLHYQYKYLSVEDQTKKKRKLRIQTIRQSRTSEIKEEAELDFNAPVHRKKTEQITCDLQKAPAADTGNYFLVLLQLQCLSFDRNIIIYL
jgi:hypothetical protein